MSANRYGGSCCGCGSYVKAHAGELTKRAGKFAVLCRGCASESSAGGELSAALRHDRAVAGTSSVLRNASGAVVSYRNARGTCEDAPCCGCCS